MSKENKNKIKLDDLTIRKWGYLKELENNKSEILKRRLFNNYPLSEKIAYIKEIGFVRADFWNYIRCLIPKNKRDKNIMYHEFTNEIEILD